MPIGALHEIVVDCVNPEALARFWQALIGGEVDVDGDDWAALDLDDAGVYLSFQASDQGAPQRSGIRFDVAVDDLDDAVDQAEQLGARKIGGRESDDDGEAQTMADPGGHQFRFVAESD
jgi:hypothetical protein